MKTCDAFFLRLGERLVKTAVMGKYHVPQLMAALSRMGLEQGVIDPEIAAAHGVLPENIELPPPEAEAATFEPIEPPPITLQELAKEEVLALLRSTSPVPPAVPQAMPPPAKKLV
jgi:hypothetical protein